MAFRVSSIWPPAPSGYTWMGWPTDMLLGCTPATAGAPAPVPLPPALPPGVPFPTRCMPPCSTWYGRPFA
eukprot:350505-Chlamydomonas_euryale.AAC.1